MTRILELILSSPALILESPLLLFQRFPLPVLLHVFLSFQQQFSHFALLHFDLPRFGPVICGNLCHKTRRSLLSSELPTPPRHISALWCTVVHGECRAGYIPWKKLIRRAERRIWCRCRRQRRCACGHFLTALVARRRCLSSRCLLKKRLFYFSCLASLDYFIVHHASLCYILRSSLSGRLAERVIRVWFNSLRSYYIYCLASLGSYYINNYLASLVGECDKNSLHSLKSLRGLVKKGM